MKVITLWQPWASLIASGGKTIETRLHDRFKGLLGQRIAIHAGKAIDDDKLRELIDRGEFPTLYRGYIVCTAVVYKVGWLTGEHSAAAMIDCSQVKRFGLFLTDIRKLEKPIPCKGKQGIWTVDFL